MGVVFLAAGILAGFLLSAPADDTAVRATLSNGMHVVILRDALAPVATTNLAYGVGSDDDTMPGIAHAAEHMFFRGTKDVSADQFAILAARAGAQYDASTSNVQTNFYFKVPSPYVDLVLRLEADRMAGVNDAESDWKVERGAIEQEVRQHESVPGAALFAQMRRTFYGDTPYARDGVGTVESFERMHASDIALFHHTWYRPNNATLIVAGDVDPQQTLAAIHRYFDTIPPAAVPVHKMYPAAAVAGTTLHGTVAELPIPVSGVVYQMPSLASKDFMAGQILSMILNNVRSGLGELQTGGKILGAFAFAGSFPDAGAMFVGGLGLPGTQPEATADAIDGVIQTYRASGVPADLFEAAKTRMLSRQDFDRSSISGLASSWVNALALNYTALDEEYAQTADVTVDDVNRVARQYLDPEHAVRILLVPKTMTSMPHFDAASVTESVQYTPDKEQPLPAWSTPFLDAPLELPRSGGNVSTFVLPNGIKLAVRRETLAPTVVLQGSIRMSTDLYEPKGKDGVGDLTTTLLPWGTAQYDRAAYEAQADALPATITLGPSFSLEVQSDKFAQSLQLLADGMLHPAFSPAGFEVVKSNSVRTLAALEKQPRIQAQIARLNALYPPGDPRRRRATATTMAAITLDDVKKWHAFAYRPDLTVISVVGDVDPKAVKAAVEQAFGQWHASGPKPSFRYPQLKQQAAKSVTVTSPSSTQSQVTLTQIINVQRHDDDYIPLLLANTMLSGEGPGSILFRDLREKRGYVYDVSSDMQIERSGSSFSIEFASEPKNVARAQAEAIAQIKRLQTAPVSTEELQRAKSLLFAQQILPMDSYSGIASYLLESARTGASTADDAEFWYALLRTTPEQIRDAMRRWIRTDRFTRVLVQPG